MSDQLTRLQVIRDWGMVLIPGITAGMTALGGVWLAHVLEARRRRRESDEEARKETWREYRTKIMEVKNLAGSLYERRASERYDRLKKEFRKDLEALNDLAGFWHSYNRLRYSVSRYINELRDLYDITRLTDEKKQEIQYYHVEIDIACTDIIDRRQPPPNPWFRETEQRLEAVGTEKPEGT